jgi:O-antigen ligase/polysaccharide polymerase Wzy-like membrane protein
MLLGAIGALAYVAVSDVSLRAVVPVVVVTAAVTLGILGHRTLLRWPTLLALLILVILFIPIRRYTVAGNLPFQLEPYRILVGLVVAAWISSMLIDPRVRLHPSGLDAPLLLFALAILLSVVVNGSQIETRGVQTDVLKAITFFASFLLLFYFIVSVVRSFGVVDFLVKVLVGGGALVGALAVLENRTGYNVFDHLGGVVPLLRNAEPTFVPLRGERLRALGSAEHPIALGAALVMLIPLGIYLARSCGQRRWWLATLLLLMGAVSTQSRTAVTMLAAVVAVYIWLRPLETSRLLAALPLILVAVQLVLPATLGPLKDSFFPKGGLIGEQKSAAGTFGQGRIADLGPALSEWSRHPIVGEGYAARPVRTDDPLSILDDQWLGTLRSTGAFGFLSLLWLFSRAIAGFAKCARRDFSPRGWFFTGATASLSAYAIGMFTYDSLSFIQVTFLLFFILGFAAAMLPETFEIRAVGPAPPDASRYGLPRS